MRCSRCGRNKSPGEFYRQGGRGRGYSGWCKQCHRDRERERQRPYRPRDKRKMRAQSAARYALKTGKIKREPCEVPGCSRTAEMHHDDYDKPLEVRWLCRRHHRAEHIRPDM